jgi:hypothetical protein
MLEKGHREVDKDTRDDAMLLALILARQRGADAIFRESGFLHILIDVAVAHERAGASGALWPAKERPAHVKGFNLTVSDHDFALKHVATDIVLALINGGEGDGEPGTAARGGPGGPRGGDGGGGCSDDAGDAGDAGVDMDVGSGGGALAAIAPRRALNVGANRPPSADSRGRGHHAPHAMFNGDNGGCIEAVADTDFFERMLVHFSDDGSSNRGGGGDMPGAGRKNPAARHAWSSAHLTELRLQALRVLEACARLAPDSDVALSAVSVICGFWRAGGAARDPRLLASCLDALDTLSVHSPALRVEIGRRGAPELCLEVLAGTTDGVGLSDDMLGGSGGGGGGGTMHSATALANTAAMQGFASSGATPAGLPGTASQARDLAPHRAALRLASSLARGNATNAAALAGHVVDLGDGGGSARGVIALCRVLQRASSRTSGLDAEATRFVSELIAAIASCCAA